MQHDGAIHDVHPSGRGPLRRLLVAFLVALGVCVVASFAFAVVAHVDSASPLIAPLGALVIVPIPVMLVLLFFLMRRGLRDESGGSLDGSTGPIAAEVAAAVARAFPAEDRAAALITLSDYGEGPDEPEATRVHLAIVRLSGGDLDRLRYYTRQAKQEYRDVLAWDADVPAIERH